MLYFIQVTTPAVPTVYNDTPILVFDGSGSGPGMINSPHGVAVHHLTDVIYVADYGNDRVCEFNPNGDVISCMSGYTTVDDTESFISPHDVSVMPDGRIVICDMHRVMLMYADTTIIHVWGSRSSGSNLGKFDEPSGVASDGYRIYVADRQNSRIQILNIADTDDIKKIDVKTPSKSFKPFDVAVDPVSGEMFVTGHGSSVDFIIIFPRNVSFRGYYVFDSNAAAPPPPPPPSAAASSHHFVVSAITFEGFKLRSSNLTHALFIQISRTSSITDIVVQSKMAAGGHFVQKFQKKKSCVSI